MILILKQAMKSHKELTLKIKEMRFIGNIKIGEKVYSKKYGEGIVISKTESEIKVSFCDCNVNYKFVKLENNYKYYDAYYLE